jgi:type IX secretion system PorP/SprF family membrane protein
MQLITKILFLGMAIFGVVRITAQTPYASQNFAITNYLNPANVGFGNNNRFNSFFRNQFAGVGDAYKTIGVAADFKLLKPAYDEPNVFGLGVQAVSEKVLNGALQTNYITVEFANRVFLDKLKNNYLSLGIGATVISRTIDREQLSFGDQYNSGRLFNSTTADYINAYPTRYATNVGLMYTSNTNSMFLQFGSSAYYLFRTAVNQTYNKVQQNFQMNALFNFEHQIWEDKTLLLHADYQNRLEAAYYYGGVAMGLPIAAKNNTKSRFYIGCFYRLKDAMIPYFGLTTNKYKVGLSYDIYQNNMTSANLHPQTLEFNLSMSLGKLKADTFASIFN